jgi:hypothetical protein
MVIFNNLYALMITFKNDLKINKVNHKIITFKIVLGIKS